MSKLILVISLVLVAFALGAMTYHLSNGTTLAPAASTWTSAPADTQQLIAEVQFQRITTQKILSALAQASDEYGMVPAIDHANDPCQEDEVIAYQPGSHPNRVCVNVEAFCAGLGEVQ